MRQISNVGQERPFGRFAVPGVDSLDSLKTTDIVMNQKRQCPDSLRAFAGHSGDRGTRTRRGVWGDYTVTRKRKPTPRSRQTDASIGGQHGRR